MRTRLISVGLMLLLTGCSDALIYGERTAFNLAIRVNDDPATPVNVNAGLQRTVVSLAPPLGGQIKDGDRTSPAGESVSAISRFDLRYDQSTAAVMAGRLTVKTQFLSGQAAVTATANPQTAARVVQLVTAGRFIANSPTKDWLEGFLGDPMIAERARALLACSGKIPRLSGFAIPDIQSDLTTEEDRQLIINCLKLDKSS